MPLQEVAGTNSNVISVPVAGDGYENNTNALLYEIWQTLLEKLNP